MADTRPRRDEKIAEPSFAALVGQAVIEHFSAGYCLHYVDPRVLRHDAERAETPALAEPAGERANDRTR